MSSIANAKEKDLICNRQGAVCGSESNALTAGLLMLGRQAKILMKLHNDQYVSFGETCLRVSLLEDLLRCLGKTVLTSFHNLKLYCNRG